MKRIVLAYSGGLHTSVAIPWLREKFDAEVITITLDVGQGGDLVEIRERALALGAHRAHVIDAREEFLRDFVLPVLQSGALDGDPYSPAAALIPPLIVRTLVHIARIEGAGVVAHGATRARSEVTFDALVRAIEPSLRVLAPGRVWAASPPRATAFAQARGIRIPVVVHGDEHARATVWGRAIRGGRLDDPGREPPEEIYTLTRAPLESPDAPAYVEVEFQRGVPVRVNGIDMPFIEILESLETIAGSHGVGRIDTISSDPARAGQREVYEVPAPVVLVTARREIEKLAVDGRLIAVRRDLSQTCIDLVYNGNWFSEAHDAISGFVETLQDRMSGSVKLKLFKGSCQIVGRRASSTAEQSSDVTSVVGQVRRES